MWALLAEELDRAAGEELHTDAEGLLVEGELGMVVGQVAVGAVKAGAEEGIEARERMDEVGKVVRTHHLRGLDRGQTLVLTGHLAGDGVGGGGYGRGVRARR